MKHIIKGKAFVLGDDIDTDQIIPAQHLVYNPAIPEERKMFGKYALSGVPAPQSGFAKRQRAFCEGRRAQIGVFRNSSR